MIVIGRVYTGTGTKDHDYYWRTPSCDSNYRPKLTDCSSWGVSSDDCGQNNDVGVACYSEYVRRNTYL